MPVGSKSHLPPLTHWLRCVYCRFCGLKGHEMFCEVERSYIEDGFNLYGLRACVSNFSDCLDLILDRIGPDDSDDSHLTQSACTLYGLIHARYIITAHGLDAMYNKVGTIEYSPCRSDGWRSCEWLGVVFAVAVRSQECLAVAAVFPLQRSTPQKNLERVLLRSVKVSRFCRWD